MEFQFVGWKLVNTRTGEIAPDIMVVQRKQKKTGGRWMKLNQDPMAFLANRKDIRGETLRVFILLTAVADYRNLLPTQKRVAQKLVINQAQVSRAYKQLSEIGFVYKKEGNYYLDPRVCWKGTQKQMDAACRELRGQEYTFSLPEGISK